MASIPKGEAFSLTHGSGAVELRANPKSISHRCHLEEVAFAWELTKQTIHLLLGCLQGGTEARASCVCEALVRGRFDLYFMATIPKGEAFSLTPGSDAAHTHLWTMVRIYLAECVY